MKKIQLVNEAVSQITAGTKKLSDISKMVEDKGLKKQLRQFVNLYASITVQLSNYLIEIVPKLFNQDSMDLEFDKIIDPLKKELKKKKRKKRNGKKK